MKQRRCFDFNRGTPNSTADRKLRKRTDIELYESGEDVEILAEILYNIIKPHLHHFSGFTDLASTLELDEDRVAWDLALRQKHRNFGKLKCVRLCVDPISFACHNDVFQISLFLGRDGNLITALRQQMWLDEPYKKIGHYSVSNFQQHQSVEDLVDWWDNFRSEVGIDRFNKDKRSLTMYIVWALLVFVDDAVARREELLRKVQEAQLQISLIYPDSKL